MQNLTLDRCSINTATLGFQLPISQTIEAIARQGFAAIAPWRREIEDIGASVVARQIRDAGLEVSGYCRSTYIPAVDRTAFLRNIDDNRRALHDAATLGSKCFVMVVGGLPTGSRNLGSAREQVYEGVSMLLDDARSLKIPLALEPLHPMYAADRSCLNTLGQALDICQTLDPEGDGILGVAVDVYHVWWDPNLYSDIQRAGSSKRLLAFHVCDWLVPTRDILMDRGMMGDGVVNIPEIRRNIEDAGYKGFVEVEIFSTEWQEKPVHEILTVAGERLGVSC